MEMNNNSDSKATLQLNYETHSENCQASEMELYLGNSLLFLQKTPSQMLNGDPSKKNS